MKMINFKTIIFSLVLLNSCNSKSIKAKKDDGDILKLYHIEVRYENMYTTSFYSINCDSFEATFNRYSSKILNQNEMNEFSYHFDETLKNNFKSKSIDTRIRLLGFSKNNSNILNLCFDLGSMKYGEDIYQISDEFREYLLKLTETEI